MNINNNKKQKEEFNIDTLSSDIIINDSNTFISTGVDFNLNKIEFITTRDVKKPSRANRHDAGVDFYIPNATKSFINDLNEKNKGRNIRLTWNEKENQYDIIIAPSERILIPSGIKVNILLKNSALIANNKSGVTNNKGLIVGSTIVDADYRGEIHLSVINTSSIDQVITTGTKLIQFIHTPVLLTDYIEISKEQFDNLEISDRGEGGFGSSGLK